MQIRHPKTYALQLDEKGPAIRDDMPRYALVERIAMTTLRQSYPKGRQLCRPRVLVKFDIPNLLGVLFGTLEMHPVSRTEQ